MNEITLTRDQAIQILIALQHRIETMRDFERYGDLAKIKAAAIMAYQAVEKAI